MPDTFFTPKASLAYAKLSATPTATSWSQVYNAGNLFACLALTKITEATEATLQTIGKDLFSNLEAEFFTLEEKNLANIKEAIQKSILHIPPEALINLSVAYFVNNTLYLFMQGHGRVIMKRGEHMGILLENKNFEETSLISASGFVENNDMIVLETEQFSKNISDVQLTKALELELPNDVAEALSVSVHQHPDGGQAAIIITYRGGTPPQQYDEEPDEETPQIAPDQPALSHPVSDMKPTVLEQEEQSEQQRQRAYLPTFSKPTLPRLSSLPRIKNLPFHLSHTKKLILSIVLLLAILLSISIIFTKQKQQNAQNAVLFQSIYDPAQKSYEEGKALASLNEELSQQDFQKAQNLLVEGQSKFSKGSTEEKKITELLQKVQAERIGTTTSETETPSVTAKEATVDTNDMLAIAKANSKATAVSQDGTNVYFITSEAVTSVNKSSGTKKELIKNDDDWSKAVGISPYQGNIYVLDKQNGILKYVAGGGGYGKNNYFKSSQDTSKAVSLAIDSSIYVLFSDGTIKKFTSGTEDPFSIKGLAKPLANPTRIFTDANTSSIYILDNGNSRIVQLGKDGIFKAQFTASAIKKATEFEIKDNKAYLLNGSKIFELPL